jgi:hypothetical protein
MSEIVTRSIRTTDGTPVNFPNGIRLGGTTASGTSINNIGVAGAAGFGLGICPGPLPSGMSALPGYDNPLSDTYGNYVYSDGSVMVWVPAFYYKWGTGANGLALNAVDIKPFGAYADVAAANTAGYAMHRAFYDGGLRDGFFIDKYLCSNNGGIFSSIKNGIPCDTDGSQSGVGAITGVGGTNNNGMVQQAAKSRGSNFHSVSLFMYRALSMLSYAHAKSSNSTAFNAWYSSGSTNFPKGCNNNALGDTNDSALVFASAGHGSYPNKPRTGSANIVARTTHNGQNCGVTGVNGTMNQVAFGLTYDGTNYYALKTSKRMRDLTGSNNTGADSFFGATGIAANYDSLGATVGALTGTGTKLMGSTSQVFSEAVSGNSWVIAGAGIPLAVGGTNDFGNDAFYELRPSDMLPTLSGNWDAGSVCGIWQTTFNYARTQSYFNAGGRAALYL